MKKYNCVREMGRLQGKEGDILPVRIPIRIMLNGSLFPYNKINLRYLYPIFK